MSIARGERAIHPFPAKLILGAQSRGKSIDPDKLVAITNAAMKGRDPRRVITGFYLAHDERLARHLAGVPWVRTNPPGTATDFTDEDRVCAEAVAKERFPNLTFVRESQDRYQRKMFFRSVKAARLAKRDVAALVAGIDLYEAFKALEAESPEYVPAPKVPKPRKTKEPKAEKAATEKVGLGSFMKR